MPFPHFRLRAWIDQVDRLIFFEGRNEQNGDDDMQGTAGGLGIEKQEKPIEEVTLIERWDERIRETALRVRGLAIRVTAIQADVTTLTGRKDRQRDRSEGLPKSQRNRVIPDGVDMKLARVGCASISSKTSPFIMSIVYILLRHELCNLCLSCDEWSQSQLVDAECLSELWMLNPL
jgi:hypothetical protein